MSELLQKYIDKIPKLKNDSNRITNGELIKSLITDGNLPLIMEYGKHYPLDFSIDTISSPLNIAVINEFTDIVQYLISMDVNVNRGLPLFTAINHEDITMIDILLQAGADVNIENEYHFTPLVFAVSIGNIDILNRLIVYGANYHINNLVSLAVKGNNLDILDMLVNGLKLPANNIDILANSLLNPNKNISLFLLNNGEDFNAVYDGVPVILYALNLAENFDDVEIIYSKIEMLSINADVKSKDGTDTEYILHKLEQEENNMRYLDSDSDYEFHE